MGVTNLGDNLINNAQGLGDFIPINSTIKQGSIEFFLFDVNLTTGVGEFYELLVFVTGNICRQPPGLTEDDPSLLVYYSFNYSMINDLSVAKRSEFNYGYVEMLADLPYTSAQNTLTLYLAVQAPENTNSSATWKYELGASQNGLVFQWDERDWSCLVDADDKSALIVTGNLTGIVDSNKPDESLFSVYLFPESIQEELRLLNRSRCAVLSSDALQIPNAFTSSYTNRTGMLQEQFFVDGLNDSTTYVAYVISNFATNSTGGALYKPFAFETMSQGSCELIYDLDFCLQVAYSVASNSTLNATGTKQLYDIYAQNLYTNFSKALQQVACNTTSTSVFSPVRTCEDCAESYKNWLCSIAIPRCTTVNHTEYMLREAGTGRNSFIKDTVVPETDYYEILPCLSMCYSMVRDCPAVFGFGCPSGNSTIALSYGWDSSDDYPTCNSVGKLTSMAQGHMSVNWVSMIVMFAVLGLVL
ncbi:stretch-activated cation channel mid1 [Scheffersomyces spartinae]|uniref:Stretch-activated cation channel mid1 n=1 Tax=Scheffersomyces spartinae TaxID=45513 RepID=A0A9P7VE31_9ASCO|nr:stretch-activated cation channel mid1 [Scheffersomyces spartinae]KAG7196169.1 stretch-activated cation channel mid1 [Scheffersomyces spartinae]